MTDIDLTPDTPGADGQPEPSETAKIAQQNSLTLGQKRVRVSFNPSRDNQVDRIKDMAAVLIDTIYAMEAEDGEQARLFALAMTSVEEAAMWAVKAATYTK